MLIPYKIRPHRENKIWEEVAFLLIYCYFAFSEWLTNRREDAKMRKREGWEHWCAGGKPEGPESPEEVEEQLDKLHEQHPEVADEEEDESRPAEEPPK